MSCAQLGQSGAFGAHLLECSLRMDKALLEPRCDAVRIYQAVNRQPSLLRSCRRVNFWQHRISHLATRQSFEIPLSEVKRTMTLTTAMSAYDPTRTWPDVRQLKASRSFRPLEHACCCWLSPRSVARRFRRTRCADAASFGCQVFQGSAASGSSASAMSGSWRCSVIQ
jgi:hypothetical protein